MKRHPRELIVSKAENNLRQKIVDWFKEEPELTSLEEMQVFHKVFASSNTYVLHYLIKEEREQKSGDT